MAWFISLGGRAVIESVGSVWLALLICVLCISNFTGWFLLAAKWRRASIHDTATIIPAAHRVWACFRWLLYSYLIFPLMLFVPAWGIFVAVLVVLNCFTWSYYAYHRADMDAMGQFVKDSAELETIRGLYHPGDSNDMPAVERLRLVGDRLDRWIIAQKAKAKRAMK